MEWGALVDGPVLPLLGLDVWAESLDMRVQQRVRNIMSNLDRSARIREMVKKHFGTRLHGDYGENPYVEMRVWEIALLASQFATAIEGEVREQCAQQESYLLEALKAARDLLVSCQKQAGYIPGQGYSTTLTAHEMTLARGIEDIDAIIAAAIRAGRSEERTMSTQQMCTAPEE